MRIGGGNGGGIWKADAQKQTVDNRLPGSVVEAMRRTRLGDLRTYPHQGVEGGGRILEHDADVPAAQSIEGAIRSVGDVDAIEGDPLGVKAALVRQQSGDGQRGQRLSCAGFADEGGDRCPLQRKREPLHHRRTAAKTDGQIAHVDERRSGLSILMSRCSLDLRGRTLDAFHCEPWLWGGGMMVRWLVRRVLAIVPTLFGVSIIGFFLMRQVPGDPATALLGFEASSDAVSALQARLHVDQSWPVQYFAWIASLLQGDFGRSLQTGRPVGEMLAQSFAPTALLAVSALGVSLAFAIPAGVVAATHPRSAADRLLTLIGIVAQSMPAFWLGVLLILGLSVGLHILPSSGYISPVVSLWGCAMHLISPMLTLAAGLAAANMRTVRSAVRQVLSADFMRTAKAKGLSRAAIVWHHGLGNAAMPIVTVISLQFGQLLSGVVVAETLFDWPGIGKLVVEAVFARDYPVVEAVVLCTAAVFVAIGLATDALYAAVDPRVRLP